MQKKDEEAPKEEELYIDIGAENKDIVYGYYHGYTLFDRKGISAHFPFGFGLSYTEFELGDVSCSKDEKVIKVSGCLTNKGEKDGDEVIQIYVGSENKDKDRPVKVLKGFRRVSTRKGEAVSFSADVEIDDIGFYCPETGEWELDEKYSVYIGCNSRDITKIAEITF